MVHSAFAAVLVSALLHSGVAFLVPLNHVESKQRNGAMIFDGVAVHAARHERRKTFSFQRDMAVGDDQDLGLKKVKVGDREFWMQQKKLMEEMTESAEKSMRQVQLEKFAQRRLALVGDTSYCGILIFCILWGIFDNPFVAFSYSFGAAMGLAYAYGLGKYVETLGGRVDDPNALQGAGVGQARFAFLILLFVIVGKFRSVGMMELPAIAGFFTYQLASLTSGLREIND